MAFNVQKAREAGYTDPEIESYLGRTGRSITQPSRQEKQPESLKRNILEEFFAPAMGRAARIAKRGFQAGGTLFGLPVAKGELPGLETQQRQIEQQSRALTQQARQAVDPAERQRLLARSRAVSSRIGGVGRRATGIERGLEQAGVTEDFSPVATGAKAAAELGAWLMPVGTAAKGIPVTRQAGLLAGKGFGKAIARGAIAGGVSGTFFGLSKEEIDELSDITTPALTGLVVGGVTAGISEGVRRAWGKLTTTFPKVLRQAGLGSQADEKFAEATLRKNAPSNYRKMAEWGKKIEKSTEKGLQKTQFKPGAIGIDTIFPDENLQAGFADDVGNLIKELKGKRRIADADKLTVAYNNLTAGTGSFQDILLAKRMFDQSAQTTFKKAATAISAQKQAARRVTGDRLRDFLRNSPQAPKLAKRLLNAQQFAIRLQGYSETAQGKLLRSLIPSWWEISALVAGATAATALKTTTPLYASLAPILLARGFKHPGFAKGLYKAGQAELPGRVGTALADFLTKGAARIAAPD